MDCAKKTEKSKGSSLQGSRDVTTGARAERQRKWDKREGTWSLDEKTFQVNAGDCGKADSHNHVQDTKVTRNTLGEVEGNVNVSELRRRKENTTGRYRHGINQGGSAGYQLSS